jgi:hypothetical protein
MADIMIEDENWGNAMCVVLKLRGEYTRIRSLLEIQHINIFLSNPISS